MPTLGRRGARVSPSIHTDAPAPTTSPTPALRSQGVVLSAMSRTFTPRCAARASASGIPEPIVADQDLPLGAVHGTHREGRVVSTGRVSKVR
jgi:hypothetical protein